MLGAGTRLQVAVMLVSVGGFLAFVSGTPSIILLPALVPAVAISLLVVTLTRYRREPGWVALAVFVGGAVIAGTLSSLANDMVQFRLGSVFGEAQARLWTPAAAAPVVEELCKALMLLVVLLVRRESEHPLLDCLIYGALVGLGFAIAENLNYFTIAAVQGGTEGLARSVYLRTLVGGLNHAIFTGLVGAGIGGLLRYRGTGRGLAALAGGFCGAVGQHVIWNAWASRTITEVLCGASDPGGACRSAPEHLHLFGTVPLIAMVSAAPGLVAMGILLRRAAQQSPQMRVRQG